MAAVQAKAKKSRGTRVTIKQVAAAAQVSPMTVSNVINNRVNLFSKRTRTRVMKEIERLGYRVQSSGRSLRLGIRKSIGLVLLDESPTYLANPFMSHFSAGLSNFLSEHGYTLVIQGIRPRQFSSSLLLNNSAVDAYCIKPYGPKPVRQEILRHLEQIRDPIMLTNETIPFHSADSCIIRQDDAGGGVQVAEHLLARGATKFFVIYPHFAGPMVEARLAGFQGAVRESSARVSVRVVVPKADGLASIKAAVDEALSTYGRPDAVFGTNDQLAIVAMYHMMDLGIRVPKDVRFVGFNGLDFVGFVRPALTTIVSSPYELGQLAGYQLTYRVERGSFEKSEIVRSVSLRQGATT